MKNNPYQRALATYRLMIRQKTTELGPEHPEVLATREEYAEELHYRGDSTQAKAEFRSIQQLRQRAERRSIEKTLRLERLFAEWLVKQGKREEAIPFAQRVVDGYRQRFGATHSRTSRAEKMLQDLQGK